ncbi:MAG: hypothetical protein ACJ8HU_01670, partial [Chthoniobacterales bacterium]
RDVEHIGIQTEPELTEELPELVRCDPAELAEIFAVSFSPNFGEDAAVNVRIGGVEDRPRGIVLLLGPSGVSRGRERECEPELVSSSASRSA